MRLRLELFVADLDVSIRFYERALGFRLARREPDYAGLELGDATIGLGPVAKLPAHAVGPGFTRERLAREHGAGVEIVIGVADVDATFKAAQQAGARVVEPLQDRPWGLRDFRVLDPDGYYLRITHP